jgi:hypothetical protein
VARGGRQVPNRPFHIISIIEDDEEKGLAVKYPYFHREKPDFFESDGTYADRAEKVENKAQYEWQHTLSDVVNSLIKAGLRV